MSSRATAGCRTPCRLSSRDVTNRPSSGWPSRMPTVPDSHGLVSDTGTCPNRVAVRLSPWRRPTSLAPTPPRLVGRRHGESLTATRLRSEEHTSELQSPDHLVCRLLLEKKKTTK